MACLGMDVGGSGARLRLVPGPRDGGGPPWAPVEERLVWPSGVGVEEDLALLGAAVERVTGGDPGRVEALGVSRPASVDAEGTITAWPNRPTWVGCSLPRALARLCPGAPASHEDDGNAAARAEAVASGADHLVYLGLGTGLAGGLVADGRVVGGAHGGAGEVGHLSVAGPASGPPCPCGRTGCLQATVSGPAVARRVTRRTRGRHGLAELPGAVRAAAPWALRERDTVAVALAGAVEVLVELVAPEQVRIGGGLLASLPGLCERVADRLEPRAGRTRPTVAPALHGGDSSLAGAVLLAHGLAARGAPARTDDPSAPKEAA
ncbi:ROK family protein [Nocardiopsis akebiae]|uniref:ROK family protein n=1 Tax=Nocardiopsis akebiae TaxID=2831968 RepID=A0ABX8BXM9_9ACTN|nr:ROK family protein [Nocardiopsis akebiae]QUX26944.1 ROK family protein [Nocardiopsis akebiae]